jgi:hypothetical protein
MRLVIGLIALYLVLDFCDPSLAGAFNFSAEESVEVVRIHKVSAPDRPVTMTPQPTSSAARVLAPPRPPRVVPVFISTPLPRQTLLLRQRLVQPAPEEAPPASPAA